MQTVLEYYLFSNDPKTLQKRLPHAITLFESGQFIHSLSCKDIDRLITCRITELLGSKDDQLKICGCKLINALAKNTTEHFVHSFKRWLDMLIPYFPRFISDQSSFLTILDVIDMIFSVSFNKADLLRDVVNECIGSIVLELVKALDDERLFTPVARVLIRWVSRMPSLMKPYSDKIEKKMKSRLFGVENVEVYAYIVQAVNCGGKQACSDQYYSLARSVLATMDDLLDKLFASVKEGLFKRIEYPGFPLPPLSSDYVEFMPQLVSCLDSMFTLLERCLSGPFVTAVQLPLAEAISVAVRVFDISYSSVMKSDGNKDIFQIALSYLPHIHVKMLKTLTRMILVSKARILRYRTSLVNLTEHLLAIHGENLVVKENIYRFLSVLISELKSAVPKEFCQTLANTLCKEFVFELRKEERISVVEQHPGGKKAKKRRIQTENAYKTPVYSQALSLAALDLIKVILEHSSRLLPESVRVHIDNCLLFNVNLCAFGNSSSPLHRFYDVCVAKKCLQILSTSIKFSSHSQSSSIPLALNICPSPGITGEILNIVRPLVPYKYSLKRKAVESSESSEVGSEVEEEIRESVHVEAIVPTSNQFSQTEHREEKNRLEREEKENTSLEINMEAVTEPIEDFSDTFSIIDADPDQ